MNTRLQLHFDSLTFRMRTWALRVTADSSLLAVVHGILHDSTPPQLDLHPAIILLLLAGCQLYVHPSAGTLTRVCLVAAQHLCALMFSTLGNNVID